MCGPRQFLEPGSTNTGPFLVRIFQDTQNIEIAKITSFSFFLTRSALDLKVPGFQN